MPISKLLKPFKPKLIWIDEHILEFLSLALLIFIPLYPKIPLADILPGYIVRLRLDDLLVAAAFLIWLAWLIRGKVSLKGNPLLIPMGAYILIGLISSLSAIFITKTVSMESLHINKLFFHFARRIEYFSVFLIFFSSIKSLNQIKKYVYVSLVVLSVVSIYGFGQKYLYWPAYSTMNREFSKGITLYLSQHARVLSTFGGHYDLAAYLMMTLTLFIPLSMVVKKIWHKILFTLVSFAGFWLMILTVSRTSFLAYILSITAVFTILAFKKNWLWAFSRWFVVITISIFIMLSFGELSDRFAHILKLDNLKTFATTPLKKELPKGEGIAFLETVSPESDTPPTTQKPSQKPSDVYNEQPDYINEGTSAVAKPRIYSQAALQYDLSTSIRLDYTWPKAIEGFSRNPLLGSGFSTLTKANIEDFTEAESTDNDFLRALGETGLLGFLTFYGAISFLIFYSLKNYSKINDIFYATVVAALTAAIVGLLVNAIYIDVFEASKVAYTFWIMVAILVATIQLSTKNKTS